MYIHRIALSVVLPAPTVPQTPKAPSGSDPFVLPFSTILEESITSQPPSVDEDNDAQPSLNLPQKMYQSLPRRLHKQTTSGSSGFARRPHSSLTTSDNVGSKSPKLHRKNIFTKQHSIHEEDKGHNEFQGRERRKCLTEWRGIRINLLQRRIRRLTVLMELSEPGTIPDPGMLASLIDLVRLSYFLEYDVGT